MHNSL